MTISHKCFGYALVGLLLLGGCRGDGNESAVETNPVHATLTSQANANTRPANVAHNDHIPRRQPGEFVALVFPRRPPKEIELVSVAVTDVPTIDGRADERVWAVAPAITTLDFSSQRPITLKSVHTDEQIFFLVTYPDGAPSTTHKSWRWDPKEEIYREGHDREDMFVFKWSMGGNQVNLAFRDAAPHTADIWFWKARRTNPSGYADDKRHIVSSGNPKNAQLILSPEHGTLHLRRKGDAGLSAYDEKLVYEYQGESRPRFYSRQPQGSRADVRAKGVWKEGEWTIEFSRKLHTGNDDDIALTRGGTYLFAVSCYEMAADGVHLEWSQPLYRTGDAFDRLVLRVSKENA